MGVRSTSKQAYSQVQESGLTTAQREQILEYLSAEDSPRTLREIQEFTLIDINAVSGRCNEMKKTGSLFEHPKRKCSITGRLVTPLSPEKPFDLDGQGALFTGSEIKPRYRSPHHYYEKLGEAHKR